MSSHTESLIHLHPHCWVPSSVLLVLFVVFFPSECVCVCVCVCVCAHLRVCGGEADYIRASFFFVLVRTQLSHHQCAIKIFMTRSISMNLHAVLPVAAGDSIQCLLNHHRSCNLQTHYNDSHIYLLIFQRCCSNSLPTAKVDTHSLCLPVQK